MLQSRFTPILIRGTRVASYSVTSGPSPRHSYSPYWLAGTAVALFLGYNAFPNASPPATAAVGAIERSMAPKTHGANVEGETPSSGYQKRA